MLVEQLIFIIIAFVLFVYMFFQLIKKNDTKYVPVLAIQALGIGIKFIEVCFGVKEYNIFVEIITYTLSIILPVGLYIADKLNKNFMETIYSIIAKIYLIFGNTKGAKLLLIKLVNRPIIPAIVCGSLG